MLPDGRYTIYALLIKNYLPHIMAACACPPSIRVVNSKYKEVNEYLGMGGLDLKICVLFCHYGRHT
jgi:hypothetical protein